MDFIVLKIYLWYIKGNIINIRGEIGMKSLLLIIDLQKSFINENTEMLLNRISDLLNAHKFEEVIFTRFVNSEESIWFKKLNYQECITE